MKSWKVSFLVLAGLAIVVTGCAKKSAEQASITGTGFESVSSTDDLAQLPQASTVSQQAGVEVYPLETSPITQGVPPIAGPMQTQTISVTSTVTAGSGLSREQQIQTALKAAGLYQGNIDGKLGPASKRAIQEFQTNNGLKVDGKVGPQTWAAMQAYLTGTAGTGSTATTEQ